MSTTLSGPLLRRYIGRRLEALRKAKGLSQTEAARAVQLGRSTIIRMEDGDSGVKLRDPDVVALLDLYEVDQETRQWLLACAAAARNGDNNGWWHDYTQQDLPEWFSLYVVLEDSAETIRQYESENIPGLLQIREYAKAVISTPSGFFDDDEIERRIQIRMERQGLLTRTKPRAPRLDVILNESVLRRLVGGTEVMTRQLTHLLDMIDRVGVGVRILAFHTGVHGGMAAGGAPFTLLRFAPASGPENGPLEPPTAYVDTLTGAKYLQATVEVDAYERVWDDLEACALDYAASRQLIAALLEGMTE